VDAQGRHTVVISDGAHRPANATADRGVTWMDAGPFLDGQLSWRLVFDDRGIAPALARALEGAEPEPGIEGFVPERVFCTTGEFEDGGFEGCRTAGRPAAERRERAPAG